MTRFAANSAEHIEVNSDMFDLWRSSILSKAEDGLRYATFLSLISSVIIQTSVICDIFINRYFQV